MTRKPGDPPSERSTVKPYWWTGTVEDEFTPIYLRMARDTMHDKTGPWRRGFSPDEVDAMGLTTVAALLGVGMADAQQRHAWDQMRAPGPEVAMVRKDRSVVDDGGGVILAG